MNPEQTVIDRIDALVDESLAHGPTDDYEREFEPLCATCAHEWHGLTCTACLCPGAYATLEQRRARCATTPHDIDPNAPGAYTISQLQAMRLRLWDSRWHCLYDTDNANLPPTAEGGQTYAVTVTHRGRVWSGIIDHIEVADQFPRTQIAYGPIQHALIQALGHAIAATRNPEASP
jgi:hypothetical protein